MGRSAKPIEPAIHPVDRHVGLIARLRRRALSLSQSTVAGQLGVSFQQLQKYERGANRISASSLHALSLILDLPVAKFFDGLPAPPKPRSGAPAPRDLVTEMVAAPDGPALAESLPRPAARPGSRPAHRPRPARSAEPAGQRPADTTARDLRSPTLAKRLSSRA
jgi:transcriptional regulator with XRE-family HTH domain